MQPAIPRRLRQNRLQVSFEQSAGKRTQLEVVGAGL